MALTTDYEQDRQEIEELMLRFLPYYMEDLQRGASVSYTHLQQIGLIDTCGKCAIVLALPQRRVHSI